MLGLPAFLGFQYRKFPRLIPRNVVLPSIIGDTTQGQTLTVIEGEWSNNPTQFTYVWFRSNVVIDGATSKTYTLTNADVGATISCIVLAVNNDGSTPAQASPVGPVITTVKTITPTANILYFIQNNYTRSLSAFADRKAGLRNVRIACIGDSTTLGYRGAVDPTVAANAYPKKLADALSASNGNWQSAWGISPPGYGVNDYDARFGSVGAFGNTNMGSLGGWMWGALPGASLTWTPTTQVDTFEIYYTVNSGLGSFTAKAGLLSPTTFNEAVGTPQSVGKAVIRPALGTNTLTISPVSGTVYIIGVHAYNSAVKEVSILSMGWGGSTTTNWTAGSFYSPLQALPAIAPDLTIIDLGLNDVSAGSTASAYTSRMTTIINSIRAYSDVMIFSPNPISANPTLQQSYDASLKQLAQSLGVALIDIYGRWGQSYGTAITNGLLGPDNTHPTIVGYADIATCIAGTVTQMAA